MFGIGMTELLVILIIVLVIFGARRLPEIGAGLGKGIKSFKSGISGKEEEKEEPPLIQKSSEEGGEQKKA
ncbi:MAG: twin-arginine translocase TatA/TatE family subunit [Candidatus Tectomicrobia bacterium]|nr:twin-arginine translocase TatA/TatE family subunit [Candidatus Tectomicrobia bacterium]